MMARPLAAALLLLLLACAAHGAEHVDEAEELPAGFRRQLRELVTLSTPTLGTGLGDAKLCAW